MYIYNISLDNDAVIDTFATKRPRRMTFFNVFANEYSLDLLYLLMFVKIYRNFTVA